MRQLTADEAMDAGLIRGPWLGELQRDEQGRLTPVAMRIDVVSPVDAAEGPVLLLMLENGAEFWVTSDSRTTPLGVTHPTRAEALSAVVALLFGAMAAPRSALVDMAQAMLRVSNELVSELGAPSE